MADGITKREAIENADSVLNRTDDNEPIFVLTGRDQATPAAIERWIEEARRIGASESKIAGAEKVLASVRAFQDENGAKIPDGE